MQGLRAAHDRSERLNRRTHHVVVGLLRGERTARRLRVEAQRPGALILGFVALDHGFMPDAPRRAILGNLFKEIIVGIEEK